MTAEEFNVILEQRIVKMRETLGIKAGEYASTKDRLHNFRKGQEVLVGTLNWSAAKVACAYALKHFVSLCELADKTERGEIVPLLMIDEKVGDAVNYLVLLEALFLERGG